MSQPDISIVIPAYNEEKRLGPTLEKVVRFFGAQPETWELVVADDGSTDGTARITNEAAKKYPAIRHLALAHAGKGATVRSGVLEACGQWILVIDADSATPIEEFGRMRPAMAEGADVVIGSRLLREPGRPVKRVWIRELSSRMHNRLVRHFLKVGVSDAHCGFKLFKREAGRDIFSAVALPGFGYDIEIMYLAGKRGYRVREIPVTWTAQPGSKVNPFREPFILVTDIFRVKKIHG